MAYVFESPHLGMQAIAATIAITKTKPYGPWKYGDIMRAVDPTLGAGEFIYLQGVASTVVGSLVMYDVDLGTTTLAPATGGVGPLAVAMSANLVGFGGWYQITGAAAVKAPNAMTPGAAVYMLAATPGSVDDAQVNSAQVLGAKVSTTTGTPATGLGMIQINRPSYQGQVV